MKTHKSIYSILVFTIVMMVGSICMSQVTVYNNFGEGHDGWDYNYGLGWTIAGIDLASQYGVEQAMGFQSTEDGILTDIWLAISRVPSSSPADTVIIRIVENPDELPPDTNLILEEWMLTGFNTWSQWNTPFHLIGNGTTMLEEGHSYWLWAIGKEETWTMWCMNEDPSFTCPHTIRREDENWLGISNETASAFRVDVSTGIGISDTEQELGAVLLQNYPNPFSTSTTISYTICTPGYVNLIIYDIYGREVLPLVNKYQVNGDYNIIYDASGLTEGLYFYKLVHNKQLIASRKMVCSSR